MNESVFALVVRDYEQSGITSQAITCNYTSWILPTNKSIVIFEHNPFEYCNNDELPVDNTDGTADQRQCVYSDCTKGYSLQLSYDSNKYMKCTKYIWQQLHGNSHWFFLGFINALDIVLDVLTSAVCVGIFEGFLFSGKCCQDLSMRFLC